MQTTWTTKSGKTIELTTTVIGKTAQDHIYTEFALTVGGEKIKVIRQAMVNGQICLEILVGKTKQFLPISKDIVAAFQAELDAVINAVAPVDVSLSEYELSFERMSRLMNNDH